MGPRDFMYRCKSLHHSNIPRVGHAEKETKNHIVYHMIIHIPDYSREGEKGRC